MQRDLGLPQPAVFVSDVVTIASKTRIRVQSQLLLGPSIHTLMIQVGGSCDQSTATYVFGKTQGTKRTGCILQLSWYDRNP
jgi:hypothetical protein